MEAVYTKEKKYLKDSKTGKRIIQWTDSNSDDQHLYFTSPTVTADGKYMVFISERNGAPNLYVINRENGTTRRLSNAKGMLRAYVYPTGLSYGLSKSSPYLDAIRQKVYWVQDDAVWVSGLENKDTPKKLSELPDGWWTAYTSLSSDGTKLCVPCTDPRAFSKDDKTQHDQLNNVPWRMLKENLSTRLYLIDTETGKSSIIAELPFWVTHVQFDPNDSKRIICNSEGPVGSAAIRKFPYWGRIWRLDESGRFSRLYEQEDGETINHENWNPDGTYIIYHGNKNINLKQKMYNFINKVLRKLGVISRLQYLQRQNHFVEARNWKGELVFHEPVNMPVSHAIATSKGDGFIVDSRDGYIYLFRKSKSGFESEVLCSHGSDMKVQDAHPHPIMTPDGRSVIYTSNIKGTSNIYEVEI